MDEAIFRMAVARLDRRCIPYWVDGGTLLGLVRDGGLIPWDEDFDFGVLSPDVAERDILAAFDSHEFIARSLVPSRGVHACHIFVRGQRASGKIDITFYERVGDRAVHVTNAQPERRWSNLLGAADLFLDADHRSETPRRQRLHRWFHEQLAPRVPASTRRQLRGAFDELFRRNCASGKRIVYDFPVEHFERRTTTQFLGVDVSVPLDAMAYLRDAYGDDWQTPKKFERWYDGATRIEG